jgi:MtrB/PioB family decaheme-associated outer membrane protein
MRNTQNGLLLRASVIAVHSALAAFVILPAAHAAEAEADEVRVLTQPANTVEVGAVYVNRDSAKFGEYNGLDKRGTTANGSFQVFGGDRYDSDSAFRWSMQGRDLGLSNRRLEGEVGDQGKFRVNYTYDESQRHYSDSYQTIYDGAGTAAQTLPSSFDASRGKRGTNAVSSAIVGPTFADTQNAALSNWQNIQAPYATPACAAAARSATGVYGAPTTDACKGPGYLIPAAMHNFDVGTQRTKHDLGLSLILSPGWELTGSAAHELKDGNKLTGVAFGGPARGVLAVEPVNSVTDQLRLGLAYVGDKANLALSYYGSFYRNSNDVWSVENPYNSSLLAPSFNNSAKMSGAPDNEMHRLALSGGYDFGHATRATMSGSYARMTQNDALLTGLPSTWSVPTASANAKVINTTFNTGVTNRSVKDLTLSAAFKYENRDNRTPVYNFLVNGGDAATAPSLFTNEPLNRKMQQLSLDADYAFARRQALRLGLDTQQITRTADSPETPFRAETTRENTLRLDYRNTLSQVVTGRAGYSHSQRRHSEYEENVLIPVNPPAPLPAADPLLPGFQQYYLADRNRDQLRTSLNIQASDALSFQTGVDYNKDAYKPEFGLKESNSWVFKLDGAFAASENLTYSAFYTYEDRKSQLDSLSIGRANSTTPIGPAAHVAGTACTGYFLATGVPADEGTDPCRQWSEKQMDKVHTFGFGAKALNLVGGKLDVGVDLAYARSRSPIEMSGGSYFGNGNTTAGTFNNVFIAAQSFPDITSHLVDLRVNGLYRLDKASAVRLNYLYRRLKSNDWQYDAYANNAVAIPAYVGTGMTSPNYNVQVVGISYVHTFR